MILLKILYFLIAVFCGLTVIAFAMMKTDNWNYSSNKELLKEAALGSIRVVSILLSIVATILLFAFLYNLIF